MTAPIHNSLEQAFADLALQRQALTDMQRRLNEAGAVVTSKNRAVRVTLDGQGNVAEIKFLTSGYRTMAPVELGALLVETIAEARAELTSQVAEVLEQVVPGSSVLDVLKGTFDLESKMDEVFAEAAATRSYFNFAGPQTESEPARDEETR